MDSSVAKQYQKYTELDFAAHQLWDKVDRELKKLIRLAKVGRARRKVVPISESRGLEIKNQFKGEDKVFAPAFARKWKVKEVVLTESD
jgi:hypothetical protein